MSTKSTVPEWISNLIGPAAGETVRVAVRTGPLRAVSMAPTARLLALAASLDSLDRPALIVTPEDKDAVALTSDLRELLEATGGPQVARLPRLDADPFRAMPAHPAVAAERVAILDRLAGGETLVMVLPVAALLTPVPGRDAIRGWGDEISRHKPVELDALARRLVSAAYRVVDVVSAPGEFARRGGLFDIWPPQEEAPLRVELWGDEVESIRRFDASSQRSTGKVEGFRWLPAREAPIDFGQADALLDRLIGRARQVLTDVPVTEEGLPRLLEETLAGIEGAPRLYHDDLVALPELVAHRLIVWDPEGVQDVLAERWKDLERAFEELEGSALPPPLELYESPSRLAPWLAAASLELSELPLPAGSERESIDLEGRPSLDFSARLEELPGFLAECTLAGRPVVLLTHTEGRLLRLQEILEEAQLSFRVLDDEKSWPPEPGEIVLGYGHLGQGVEFRDGGPLLFAEPELFGADPPPPTPRRRRAGDAFIADFRDLKEGDLVVHVDHGVGRYTGLRRRPVTGEELLVLEYSAGDRLMVPVARLDLIQKYSGGEQAVVPLDKLGGQGWDRRQRRVRRAVQEIAKELLELYARRRTVRAPVFGDDSVWQREFEAAFPHVMTADQASTLGDIKADLAAARPMDRLLCGDVGYGKTEVALRAAFKVVQEGWQVAVLVPTTVLAFQHLTTFRARMAAWPVRVEAVSRLVPAAKARKIIADTAEGKVDILIGTHRLLGKDLKYRRLGLLVIDEEQRFGVKHKEALKSLALGVHVLAMSATPIPRTLQMSLAGARDLSVIETPPRNRLAIQTHLAPWSDSLISAAIRNELRRGGQVYFIHPRIQGLAGVAARVQQLVPEASVAFAHGQMHERDLESVMLRFIRGEAQVLVATSIVENGLDIPRANTIFVDGAHKFGLSQLYQMRGRVGRSDQRAYAYMLVPSRRGLTPVARRRLSALVEFSDLGSGFRIAALDLDIRGAGDFLGARQSGHIAAVGFELYVQMLERAVQELKGVAPPQAVEPVTINLGVEAHLTEEYLPDPGQRLGVYKELSRAETREEVSQVMDATEDRYGRLPGPARDLFRLAELRVMATEQGAVAIDWAGDGIAVRYGDHPRVNADRIIELLERDSGAQMTPAGVLKLRVGDSRADRIVAARLALSRIVQEA